jgi:hypothetical protein
LQPLLLGLTALNRKRARRSLISKRRFLTAGVLVRILIVIFKVELVVLVGWNVDVHEIAYIPEDVADHAKVVAALKNVYFIKLNCSFNVWATKFITLRGFVLGCWFWGLRG